LLLRVTVSRPLLLLLRVTVSGLLLLLLRITVSRLLLLRVTVSGLLLLLRITVSRRLHRWIQPWRSRRWNLYRNSLSWCRIFSASLCLFIL
jgi:hypothetical protein